MKRHWIILIGIFLWLTQVVFGGSLGYITIFVEGDVRLFVIDSHGRKEGYDPKTNQYYDEMNDFVCGPMGNDVVSGWDFTSSRSYNAPFEEQFEFHIIGMRKGKYKLSAGFSQVDNKGEDFEFEGEIDSLQVITYNFFYSTDTTKQLYFEEGSLNPVSKIDNLIRYIENASQNKYIHPVGIATSLISKLEVAKQALEQEKSKESVNALNAFLNELEAQHEKHIAEEVYLYLKGKVEALIKQIGSSG